MGGFGGLVRMPNKWGSSARWNMEAVEDIKIVTNDQKNC